MSLRRGNIISPGILVPGLSILVGAIEGAAQSMQRVVEDYRTTRELLDQTLGEAGRIVKGAKDRVSLTSDTLRAIQQATASVNTAQIEVDKLVQVVAEVLGESTSEFQTRLAETMTMVNRDLVNTTTKITGLFGRVLTQLATDTTPDVVAEGT